MDGTSMTRFNAVIMAADRNPDDPVARAANVRCKALAPIDGQSMVVRVLRALEQSDSVASRLLCGPPREIVDSCQVLRQGLDNKEYLWIENRESPSRSAEAAMEGLPTNQPVLLTTADHALLDSRIVDYFCTQALASNSDLLIALARYTTIKAAYPAVKRTVLRFSDQPCCSCNLFAFMSPAARRVTGFWREVEQERKKPWRVMRTLGWWQVLRYLMGRLSLEQALSRISTILGIRVGVIIMPFPEAAVDVDNEGDLILVRQLAETKKAPGSHPA